MRKYFSGRGLVLALSLSLGTAANAAGMDGGEPLGGGKVLFAAAAQSMATVRIEDRMLEGSKYTREASCIPGGGVTRAQIVLATMAYLKQNPQERGLPPGILLRHALQQAYPCPD